GPIKPWVGLIPEGVRHADEPDFTGFEVLQDSRIIDLRLWKPDAPDDTNSLVYGYRRLKIRKRPEHAGNNRFLMDMLTTHPKAMVRFPQQRLQPRLFMSSAESTTVGENMCRWQMSVDLQRVPPGEYVDLIYEHMSPGEFVQRRQGSTMLAFHFKADTAEVTRWFLMPKGKSYRNYKIVQYETGKPDTVEEVKLVTEYLADDYSILAYKLMSLKAGMTYEVTWYYQ